VLAHPLVELLARKRWLVAGLMSGTSMDGIDAALLEVDGAAPDAAVRLRAFVSRPFTEAERARVFALLGGDTRTICDGNAWLGERFADALMLLHPHLAAGEHIDLVGSHGQTVWHQPPSQLPRGGTPSTLQLAEPAVIAARSRAITVGDFRVADVALGGEGAPLVPWADWRLFRRPGVRRLLQNIGGIANVSRVTDDFAALRAFDNGPGNVMIDALTPAASHGAELIDRDGAWSARGTVQDDLLNALLADSYLAQAPPKSTGRERYGRESTLAWAAAHGDRSAVDLLATVVAFTAHAIADSYRRFFASGTGVDADEVLVSGGGAYNRTLMSTLQKLLAPLPVRGFAEATAGLTIEADAKEAVAFALLAVECVCGRSANVPAVTGARGPARLGKICLPPL
jgi:anhydro-N-acetylmuramic acid kinase